jgi:ABC-type Na+ efflux pump permease subunit
MISFRHIGLIAGRDFWAIVQTKSFLIGIAAFIFVAATMPGMVFIGLLKADYRIAVLDPTGLYAPELTRRIQDTKHFQFVDIRPEAALDAQRESLLKRVREKEFFALIEIIPQAEGEESFSFSRVSLADKTPADQVQNALHQFTRERRAARLGISAGQLRQLDHPMVFQNRRIMSGQTKTAKPEDYVRDYLLPSVLIFALYGLISFQSERLLTALLEEKLKRLIEVLLTRVTMYELLLGKMLGILYVGGMLFLGVSALLISAAFLLDLMHYFTLKSFLSFTLFYITGYALYATFYAIIGVSCTSTKDAENLSIPLRMLLVLPLLISVYVTTHPSSAAALFFAYFPLTAPFVMINRLTVSEVAAWELALASLSILLAAGAGIWASVKVFQASIIAQGRSLTLRDIVRAIRGRSVSAQA